MMPSLSHTFLHGYKEFFVGLDQSCSRAHLGYDIARNAILVDEARMTKKLILCFPEPLSMDHYCNAKGELESETVPFKSKNSWSSEGVSPREIVQTHAIISWKVAVDEQEQRFTELPASSNRKEEEAKKLALKLQRMSLS
jgi:hypothetical protein